MNKVKKIFLIGFIALNACVTTHMYAGMSAAVSLAGKIAMKRLPLVLGAGIGVALYKGNDKIHKKINDDKKAFKEWMLKPHVWASSIGLAALTGWATKAGFFSKVPAYALTKLAYSSLGYVAVGAGSLYVMRALVS